VVVLEVGLEETEASLVTFDFKVVWHGILLVPMRLLLYVRG